MTDWDLNRGLTGWIWEWIPLIKNCWQKSRRICNGTLLGFFLFFFFFFYFFFLPKGIALGRGALCCQPTRWNLSYFKEHHLSCTRILSGKEPPVTLNRAVVNISERKKNLNFPVVPENTTKKQNNFRKIKRNWTSIKKNSSD